MNSKGFLKFNISVKKTFFRWANKQHQKSGFSQGFRDVFPHT